jgi:hypothetical protein
VQLEARHDFGGNQRDLQIAAAALAFFNGDFA